MIRLTTTFAVAAVLPFFSLMSASTGTPGASIVVSTGGDEGDADRCRGCKIKWKPYKVQSGAGITVPKPTVSPPRSRRSQKAETEPVNDCETPSIGIY